MLVDFARGLLQTPIIQGFEFCNYLLVLPEAYWKHTFAALYWKHTHALTAKLWVK
jgi:hypothetical protein